VTDERDHQICELERRLRWANDSYQRLSRVLDDALAGWRMTIERWGATIERWDADIEKRAADVKAQAACVDAQTACAEAAAALENAALEEPMDALATMVRQPDTPLH
jgi:hypothetical protein